jgi:hypothetical protein
LSAFVSNPRPHPQEYTEAACACLRELCGNPKLHFLLHGARAIPVLLLRMQDAQFSSAAARLAACGALSNLVRYSDEQVANRDIRVWHLVIENGS